MQNKPLLDELRGAAPLLSVGILTADLLSLGSELGLLQEAGIRLVHIDVMDGCYCPMITVGADIIVTGSAVFDGKNPRENAAFMIDAVGRTAKESRHNRQAREA